MFIVQSNIECCKHFHWRYHIKFLWIEDVKECCRAIKNVNNKYVVLWYRKTLIHITRCFALFPSNNMMQLSVRFKHKHNDTIVISEKQKTKNAHFVVFKASFIFSNSTQYCSYILTFIIVHLTNDASQRFRYIQRSMN